MRFALDSSPDFLGRSGLLTIGGLCDKQLFPSIPIDAYVDDDREECADVINRVKEAQRGVERKDEQCPEASEAKSRDRADHHGGVLPSKCAQGSRKDLHDAGYEVGQAEKGHFAFCKGSDIGTVGHEVQQRIGKQNYDNSERKADRSDVQNTCFDRFGDSVKFFCTKVLTHHRSDRACNCGTHGVNETIKLRGNGAGGHGISTQLIYSGGKEQVAYVEENSAHRGGDSDSHDLHQFDPSDTQMRKLDSTHALASEQADQRKCEGNRVGKHGCYRDTCHIQMKSTHEQHVECDVCTARNQHVQHRMKAVSRCSQNRSNKVIKHGDRHAEKIDLHIQGRHIQNLGLALQEDQQAS